MSPRLAIARACERVPGVLRCVLALMPEGFVLGGFGSTSSLDYEPLVRSASRCLAANGAAGEAGSPGGPGDFVEYAFVVAEELVVVQRGRTSPRLVLVVACTREPNLSLVLTTTRAALRELEASADLPEWGIS